MRIKYSRKLRIEKIEMISKRKYEIFVIDEGIRISNFLRLNSEKMFTDALNPMMQRKYERELEDKRIDYLSKKRLLQSADHCKRRRDYWIKESIKMENSN